MLVIILIAALVSFVVKTFIVRSFYIPSGSMERTLLVNDRILVDELTPRWAGYDRGDVVVFQDPGGMAAAAAAESGTPGAGRGGRLGADVRRHLDLRRTGSSPSSG